MDAQDKTMIREALIEYLVTRAPEANLRSMYGGTVFELEPGNFKSQIGGVFVYKGHLSLEFSEGASFDDIWGVLEGSGKHRRHIKLRAFTDIDAKHCHHFMDAAIAGYQG